MAKPRNLRKGAMLFLRVKKKVWLLVLSTAGVEMGEASRR